MKIPLGFSDELAGSFLINSVICYSMPPINSKVISHFHQLRKQIEDEKARTTNGRKKKRSFPSELTLTHLGILSWLRWKKGTGDEITQDCLESRVQVTLNVEDPKSKLSYKLNELVKLELIKEQVLIRDRRQKKYEISNLGLQALALAEENRKKYFSEMIELLGPKRMEKLVPLFQKAVNTVDQKMLK